MVVLDMSKRPSKNALVKIIARQKKFMKSLHRRNITLLSQNLTEYLFLTLCAVTIAFFFFNGAVSEEFNFVMVVISVFQIAHLKNILQK